MTKKLKTTIVAATLGLSIIAVVLLCIRGPRQEAGGAQASPELLKIEKAAAFYRDQIEKHPKTVKNYVEYAQLLLQEGRIAGNNAACIPKAQQLLEKALTLEPESYEANVTKGTLLLTLHQFRKAKNVIETAVAKRPRSATGYGVLTDALVELGEYEKAVEACDRMLSLRPDLRSYSRASYLRELHGDVDGAIEAMRLAADAGVTGQENRAWALYNLGSLYLREGKADTAERIYSKILEERPGYPHAYHGLARVELRKGNLQEAVRLYRSAIKALDEPAFHEELGEALQAMGRDAESENEYTAAEEGYRKESSGGEDNAMEYAHFLAAHDRQLGEALRLAQGAFQRRPSIHASEILALALHKTGRDAEALRAITTAQRLGTRDAGMHYLAGCILDRLGRTAEAQREITLALSLDPKFSTLEGPKAQAMLQRHARKKSLASAR